FAKQEFLFAKTDEKGVSYRKQLEKAQELMGRPIPELMNLVELPEKFLHVWSYFLMLHGQRQGGGMGFSPISYSDILAFCFLLQTPLKPREVEAILILDNVVAGIASDEQKAMEKKSKDGGSKGKGVRSE
ncbi:MAG: phage tail assembly chaperone, partial [Waterburya sp.]